MSPWQHSSNMFQLQDRYSDIFLKSIWIPHPHGLNFVFIYSRIAAVVAAPMWKLWLLYLWLTRLAHVRDNLSWLEKNWREIDDPSINENSAVLMFVCFLTCQYFHTAFTGQNSIFLLRTCSYTRTRLSKTYI